MRTPLAEHAQSAWKSAGWFAGLWLAGVLAMAGVALGIKLVMRLAGFH